MTVGDIVNTTPCAFRRSNSLLTSSTSNAVHGTPCLKIAS